MVHESGHTNFPAFKELSNSAASITEYIRSTPGKKDPGPCFLSQKPWSCPILGTWSNSLSWRAGFKGPDPTASNSSSRGGQSLLPLEALLLRTAPLPPPPSTSGLQHVGPSKLPSSPSSPLTRVSHWLWRPLPSQVDRYLISLSLSLSLSLSITFSFSPPPPLELQSTDYRLLLVTTEYYHYCYDCYDYDYGVLLLLRTRPIPHLEFSSSSSLTNTPPPLVLLPLVPALEAHVGCLFTLSTVHPQSSPSLLESLS